MQAYRLVPELPDLTLYIDALSARIAGQTLAEIRLLNPFLLRSVTPPLQEFHGKRVTGLRRIGKRIVIEFEHELYLVLHLMRAGRLRWRQDGESRLGRIALARLRFSSGELTITEAGTQRRAALHAVRGAPALRQFDAGGLEVLAVNCEEFARRLRQENHTLKRALADPRLFSGIGNAYSDEILHRARLSPLALTQKLGTDEVERLYAAAQAVLREWTQRLSAQAAGEFPENVTAFRPEMAVHGKFGQPCPACGTPIQRIVYEDNETNYCPRCQTGGKLLADRALSKLLKKSWPKSLDELG